MLQLRIEVVIVEMKAERLAERPLETFFVIASFCEPDASDHDDVLQGPGGIIDGQLFLATAASLYALRVFVGAGHDAKLCLGPIPSPDASPHSLANMTI